MKEIRMMTFVEVILAGKRRQEEALQFVRETGLCHACKKNSVRENDIRCQECIDESDKILTQLRGTPGFMEIKSGEMK